MSIRLLRAVLRYVTVMKMYRKPWFLALFLTLGISRAFCDFADTRSVGLSGALRGGTALNESLYSNPASFAFTEKYSIETQISFQNQSRYFNASVIDSKTASFDAGIGYTYRESLIKNTPNDSMINAILAKRFGLFSAGLGGKYGFSNNSKNFLDAYSGLLFEAHPSFHLGIMANNILTPSKRELGVGSQLNIKDLLLISVDGVKALSQPGIVLQSGMEVLHASTGISVRGGVQYHIQKSLQSFSFGGGWSQYKIGIHYGFSHEVQGATPETIHIMSLRVFF